MNEPDVDRYRKVEQEFLLAFESCKSLLTADAVADVEHYLQHAELELAFESLGLSLRGENVRVPIAAKELLYPLGSMLGLVAEGVLSVDFWEKVSPLLKP